MELPRRVVDAVGDLLEQIEVLSPQIKAQLWATEVEAPVFAQLTLRILPLVTLPVGCRLDGAKRPRRRSFPHEPDIVCILHVAWRQLGDGLAPASRECVCCRS